MQQITNSLQQMETQMPTQKKYITRSLEQTCQGCNDCKLSWDNLSCVSGWKTTHYTHFLPFFCGGYQRQGQWKEGGQMCAMCRNSVFDTTITTGLKTVYMKQKHTKIPLDRRKERKQSSIFTTTET